MTRTKNSRPSITDPGILKQVCERLASGQSMRLICADTTMPVQSQVYLAMTNNPDVRSAIARAREAQQDALVDEMIEIADGATPEDWNVRKLRIWARQWTAMKLSPKKYGDSSTLEINGGASPVKMVVEFVDPPHDRE